MLDFDIVWGDVVQRAVLFWDTGRYVSCSTDRSWGGGGRGWRRKGGGVIGLELWERW